MDSEVFINASSNELFFPEFMAFGEDITALISGLTVTAPDAETTPEGRTICNNYGRQYTENFRDANII